MIKLVATDIDGTIFIPEKEFTSGVKNCIKNLSDKEKIKELEKQIELQQIEIEYLKKLSALVQARKDREQQKK